MRWIMATMVGLVLVSGDLSGQQGIGLDFFPEIPTVRESAVISVSGSGPCPSLQEPLLEDFTITLVLDVHCLILPPTPVDFTLRETIGPLPPARYTVRVVDPLQVLLAEGQLVVVSADFSLTLEPPIATETDTVRAVLQGTASCPGLFDVNVDGGRIVIDAGEVHLCDPPPSFAPFTLPVDLGTLSPGRYEVELRWDEHFVAIAELEIREAGACVPSPTSLCLRDDRFRLQGTWTTPSGATGPLRAVELEEDSGVFWFFADSNLELLVKVLDACTRFDHYWVFASGATNVGVDLNVTDTVAKVNQTYHNPLGSPFAPILDTSTFATCP